MIEESNEAEKGAISSKTDQNDPDEESNVQLLSKTLEELRREIRIVSGDEEESCESKTDENEKSTNQANKSVEHPEKEISDTENDKNQESEILVEKLPETETPEWVKAFISDKPLNIEDVSPEEFYSEMFSEQPMNEISDDVVNAKVIFI